MFLCLRDVAMLKVKQVIVLRKDLNMRKGKMVAQGAHASMKYMLDNSKFDGNKFTFEFNDEWKAWLNGAFTKVALSVNSEQELLELYEKAIANGLPASLIIDNGLTEFNGVKTKTAIAIGPAKAEAIDEVTGHLSLI